MSEPDAPRRVLIPTRVAPEVVDALRSYDGLEVENPGEMSQEELGQALGGFDGVVIRSNNRITGEMIEAASRLRVVGRAGTGLDNVDVDTATRHGVVVMNTPGVNAIAAAEHTVALLLALARRLPAADRSVKQGRWERGRFLGVEVTAKTLGLIGLGRIGLQVARRALGLGMRVVAHDPFVRPDAVQDESIRLLALDELLAASHFISTHAPLVEGTRHLLNRDTFARMRDGVCIINCARGGIVDEEALCDAIDAGKVAGAALDVFEQEPPSGARVTRYDQIITTPHLGGSTREAQLAVGLAIARQVGDFLSQGIVQNAANAAPVTGQTRALVGPFLDLSERMGAMAAQLVEGPARRLTLTLHGERCTHDVRILAASVLKGLLSESMEEYGVNLVNAPTLARERGIELQVTEGSEREDFTNLICVRVESDADAHEVWGTQFGKWEGRVVNLDGYPLEMKPQGAMIVLLSANRPGVIGRLGGIIARHGGNISKMNNGCSPDGTRALSTLNLDEPPPDAMLEELRQEADFDWIRLVRL
ncbi:MAG: phosphoglycerate dehydrogenase [Candidatus Latescibacterota bacterium]|nr:MAG: phosphoglycerate dehydrogenase [Candidatus Latescibacterota bacterium]